MWQRLGPSDPTSVRPLILIDDNLKTILVVIWPEVWNPDHSEISALKLFHSVQSIAPTTPLEMNTKYPLLFLAAESHISQKSYRLFSQG
jgi:hypothetical protein